MVVVGLAKASAAFMTMKAGEVTRPSAFNSRYTVASETKVFSVSVKATATSRGDSSGSSTPVRRPWPGSHPECGSRRAWARLAVCKRIEASCRISVEPSIEGCLRDADLVERPSDGQMRGLNGADDLKLLGGGVPHSIPSPSAITLFEQTVFEGDLGQRLFELTGFGSKCLNLIGGRFSGGIASQPLLAASRNSFDQRYRGYERYLPCDTARRCCPRLEDVKHDAIFSSAEKCRLVARRMSLTVCSALRSLLVLLSHRVPSLGLRWSRNTLLRNQLNVSGRS